MLLHPRQLLATSRSLAESEVHWSVAPPGTAHSPGIGRGPHGKSAARNRAQRNLSVPIIVPLVSSADFLAHHGVGSVSSQSQRRVQRGVCEFTRYLPCRVH